MNGDILHDLKGFVNDAIESNLGLRPEETTIALNNADAAIDELLHEFEDQVALDEEDHARAVARCVREEAILSGY